MNSVINYAVDPSGELTAIYRQWVGSRETHPLHADPPPHQHDQSTSRSPERQPFGDREGERESLGDHRLQHPDRSRRRIDLRAHPDGDTELVFYVTEQRALEGGHAERREVLVENFGQGEAADG